MFFDDEEDGKMVDGGAADEAAKPADADADTEGGEESM